MGRRRKRYFRDYKRIQCVVRFIGILKVISKNINQKKKNKILELLTISSADVGALYK